MIFGKDSGPNCFDHMIASVSIMPSTIRSVLDPKLSDHAALVAEWQAIAGSHN
jgi:hypothetical protein